MDWISPQGKEDFEKIFSMALHDGLQKVMLNDEAVVVMSEAEFKRLKGGNKVQQKEYGFKEHLLNFPKVEGLILERDKDLGFNEYLLNIPSLENLDIERV